MTPNTDQAEFWNSQTSWVQMQAAQDSSFAPVLDLVIDRARLSPGQDVLDIGCGTGASLLAAVERVSDTGSVTGLDIAPNLLDLATQRCRNHPNINIRHGDAQTEIFEREFDAVISRFGVMFFADTVTAFSNISNALREGAHVSFAVWGPAPQNPLFMNAAKVVRHVLGEMPKVDRTLPGPFALENADRLRGVLDAAGLSNLTIETVETALTPPGRSADFANLALEIGPAASGLHYFEADADQRAALKQALAEEYAQFETSNGLRIPAVLHLIQGTA